MAHWKKFKKIGCRCVKEGKRGHKNGVMVAASRCTGKRKPPECVKHKRAARARGPFVARGKNVHPFGPMGPGKSHASRPWYAPWLQTAPGLHGDELTIGHAAPTVTKLCGCKANILKTKRGERKVVACTVANPETGKVAGVIPRFVNAADYAAARTAKRICVFVPKFGVNAMLAKGMMS
jgi:hypothetical protein